LSGGEAQRIRLATQIGSNLMGVLYILDEPSIGLHQRDNAKLIDTLHHLRNLGNTLIVVEHDEDTMMASDWIIDMGPGAGVLGGRIVAEGTPQQLLKNKASITGQYLAGRLKIAVPKTRRTSKSFIELTGASAHNLKNISVKIPCNTLTAITGVSGSGKSTLINQTLVPVLHNQLHGTTLPVGKHESLKLDRLVDKIIVVDQSPIGRTPRSNPATYTKVFDEVRLLYAATKEAKLRGYKEGRFSFNVPGGRCEACQGDGVLKIEMNFLPDIYVECETCKGRRYNNETLQILFKGKNITEVLSMTVDEAYEFFESIPSLARKLQTLQEVGLGYIKLGQASTTLSGGEAQRIKLTRELAKRSMGHTVYVLDEPTTGLHFEDIQKLLGVLNRIVEKENTVIVIEHNLDVIKSADWIIDLGPEGGDRGGTIVCTGTPEDVARVAKSYTGQFLKKVLGK
jgi:excinuclease ABC subunit A